MKQKLITITLTLIAVLAPLLIIPNGDNYNILKLILLLTTGLALLILLLASYKTLTIDKKDIIILIFLGLVFLSTFLSSNIKTSIIGENNRYEGLLMFITYICIYFSAKKYFKYEKISTFLNIMFYVSIIIGILGIAQKYISYMPLYPIFNKGICSTFGNSNFFGSFISIVLPIASAIFILKGSKKGFILSLIMFFNMISSGTRSAWVAFAVVGILGLIYLIKQRNKEYFKRTVILLICFIIVFIYLFNGFDFILKKFGITKKNNISSTTEIKINQIKNDLKKAKTSGISNEMGSSRIEIWKVTLKLIAKKPVIGCGVDNLKRGLIENCRDEALAYANRTNALIDKAHNEYLQIGATLGIPALICYLIFIALILFPKIKLAINNKIYFIICLSIISYLVQAFFNISTIGVAPLFWMLLGLIDNKDFINKLDKIL
ncbi:MAG: O-antigen ligase family protein [Clostridia bacterium]|nr:O-antigen ligase family protein [Clostridia bacterium]